MNNGGGAGVIAVAGSRRVRPPFIILFPLNAVHHQWRGGGGVLHGGVLMYNDNFKKWPCRMSLSLIFPDVTCQI